jgi:PQQ-dependent dehydrogenase (s-GDH family)
MLLILYILHHKSTMMKKPLLLVLFAFLFSISSFAQSNVDAGPLNEVFRKTDLRIGTAAPTPRLWDPWEITYGPDDSLWITEAKAYTVSKISPVDGHGRVILDISKGSTFLTGPDTAFNMKFSLATNNPQGGLMGMAIHPDFNDPVSPKKYVYIAYVRTYDSTSVNANAGVFYTNRVVRFTYNTATNKLDSPVSLCDTLPGSSDHNSGRLIIAPVGGKYYLFYAQGDMGAGQFGNAYRTNKAQNVNSYEGKILRFNLVSDGDAGLDQWIPDSTGVYGNPFNGAKQSAVWAMGIRNNQGFAYANGKLYGSSHGPFSDDEINWLQAGKNYGHPLVIGDSTDANYDGAMAGGSASSLPLIVSEKTNARNMGAAYGNPVASFYAAPKGTSGTPGTIQYIYSQFNGGNQANGAWPSEAISGMDLYTNSMVPGWKNSLLFGCLKGGRIMRMNLTAAGDSTAPNRNINDTNTLFRSINRFRDVAISPDGKSIFTVIDSSATTSGPTTNNPIISACRGCVQKYTFLGYNANAVSPFASLIDTTIKVAAGTINTCETANKVVINAANFNTNIWVPITDTNSNIIAEIYANGNNLDTVSTSFYKHNGTIREDQGHHMYLDRNITITPQTQPLTNVRIRLYITKTEFNTLNSALNSLGQPSGIAGNINNLGIFKNGKNVCASVITGGTASPVTVISRAAHSSVAYVLQSNALPSFSTFYFANSVLTSLPVQLISFTGKLDNNTTLLNWATSSEVNSANFVVERSLDGSNYTDIGTVTASGNSTVENHYSLTDNDVANQSSPLLYYRLRIVDVDGNYAYSNVITISLADIAGRVSIFPNPVTIEANVTIGATVDGKAQWKIIDNAGRVVLQSSSQLKKGRNNLVINVSKLSAGLYYLSVSGAGVDQQVKLQKL